jgi:cytochrome c oxidase subunit 1
LAPPGFLGWFTHVNHRSIGKRFILTALIFFLLGGIQALLIRLQLGVPENTLIGPDFYNQLFTMHGTTMMFFFAVPVRAMASIGTSWSPSGSRCMSCCTGLRA